MSAKTRQTDEKGKFVKLLARLGGLLAQTFVLIESGKRDKEQVKLMLHALQLFKEDRLGWVASGVKRLTQLTRPELTAALSMRIGELPLSPIAQRFFARYGLLYVGEALAVPCGGRNRSSGFRGIQLWNKEWRELNVWLSQRGISWEFLPHGTEWRPPYWNEHQFRAQLGKPVEESFDLPEQAKWASWDFGELAEMGEEIPVDSLKQKSTEYFFETYCVDLCSLEYVQPLVKSESGLHAGMGLVLGLDFSQTVAEAERVAEETL